MSWRISENSNEWFPCHLYDSDHNSESVFPSEEYVAILTRNASLNHEKRCNVRKMSREDYLAYRESQKEQLGPHFEYCGFHSDLEADLELFDEAEEVGDKLFRDAYQKELQDAVMEEKW